MRKLLFAVVAPLVVGGCALPMSVRIASWAVDGISYVATEKSLSDHMLSAVMDSDCAVWRTVKGEDICIDTSDEIQVATAEVTEATRGEGEAGIASSIAPVSDSDAVSEEAESQVAAFETAAGSEAESAEASVETSFMTSPETEEVLVLSEAEILLAALPEPRRKPAEPDGEVLIAASAPSPDGYVYVIGTYSNMEDAARNAGTYAGLRPAVLHRRLDGRVLYRLVVAFDRPDERAVRARLVEAGVRHMWAAKFNGDLWPQVPATELARAVGEEIAERF